MNGPLYFILFNIAVASMENKTMVKKEPPARRLSALPPSQGRLADVTVYLGYANNPFGPSIRFQHKNGEGKFNYSLEEGKENFLDTGQNVQEGRSKRGVIHLYNMISCATGCDPLSYKGYGCFCGFLGSGYPVDGIDRCCKIHDWCYDSSNCPTFSEYFVPYYWKCYRNRPLCALDNGEWGGGVSCAQRLCQCDKLLAECLRRYPCPSSRAFCTSSPLRLFQNAVMIF